jgi:agmatinase
MASNNFLNISSQYSSFKNSKAIVVPFPYESSTSYGKGTKFGPDAVISASSQVELFDEEFQEEVYKKIGICTWSVTKHAKSGKFYLPLVKEIRKIISANKFPIILGGEHSITRGATEALGEKYKTFSVLQFDAHADLRDTYERNKFSHACAMRRVLGQKEIKSLIQVGIRNISNDPKDGSEFDFYKKNQKKIKTFWAKDMSKWKISEILKNLEKNVYLTFDVDVFDPGIMPSTGTPEPGGINWYQALEILKEVFCQKNVIGCDIVELSPIKNLSAPDFMIAKLIYKMIGYKFLR